MKALGKYILVEIKEKTKTESGVALPSTSDFIDEEGEVLSVGPEVKDKENITIGSTVIFKSWAPDVVKREGKKVSFISEDLILGKL